jgi:hypothetical protein
MALVDVRQFLPGEAWRFVMSTKHVPWGSIEPEVTP